MTNKIEPVSKAAAVSFLRMCKNSENGIDDLIQGHITELADSCVIPYWGAEEGRDELLASFLRAVADQLDPLTSNWKEMQAFKLDDHIYMTDEDTRKIMRKCFRGGYDHAINKVKSIYFGQCEAAEFILDGKEIEYELKKQGLLGDKEND